VNGGNSALASVTRNAPQEKLSAADRLRATALNQRLIGDTEAVDSAMQRLAISETNNTNSAQYLAPKSVDSVLGGGEGGGPGGGVIVRGPSLRVIRSHRLSQNTSSPAPEKLSYNDPKGIVSVVAAPAPAVADAQRSVQSSQSSSGAAANESGATDGTQSAPGTSLSTEPKPFELAFSSWNVYLKFNDSVVTDIFVGQLQSTIQCMTCNHRLVVALGSF
jgi:hypothetical protein